MATAYHRILCREIVVTSANNMIVFQEDGAGPSRTATIPVGSYYLSGAAGVDDVIAVIAQAMGDAPSAVNEYNETAGGPSTSTPYMTWQLTTTGTSFAFIDSGTTFPLADIGWDVADDGAFAATYSLSSSTVPQVVTWSAGVISSVQDPSEYENDGVYHHRRPDGSHVTGRTADPVRSWPMLWEYVAKGNALIRHEASQENSYEQFWNDVNDGERLRIYEGTPATLWAATLVAEGVLSLDDRTRLSLTRDSDVPTYRVEGVFVEDMSA